MRSLQPAQHDDVVCSAAGRNAARADEWVEVEDLVALTKTYALTIADWLA